MSGLCTLHWSGSHDAGIRDAASPSRTKDYHHTVSKQAPLGHSKTMVDRFVLYLEELRSPGLVSGLFIILTYHYILLVSGMRSGHFVYFETETGSDKSQSWDTVHVSRASCLQ